MDEVERLERELERIQQRDPGEKKVLNERACVEILHKLLKKRNLTLITSLDGETFYTKKYLLLQISELLRQKGRLSLDYISKSMKISMDVVLKLSKELEKSGKEAPILYKNDLITQRHIDEIFRDVNEELQDLHAISLHPGFP